MGPDTPPNGSPDPVFTAVYRDARPELVPPGAQLSEGRLIVTADSPNVPTGAGASPMVFRDVSVDARLTLLRGGEDTVYGLYVRQTAGASYAAVGMTPSGVVVAGLVADNAWHPMSSSQLAPDLPFEQGVGASNRLQVVTMGPALVFVVNGAVVTAFMLDGRFKQGYLGFWLSRGQLAEQAVVGVDWIQVRPVLPDQPA